ncbi:MAG: AAA family ATPase [Bryobacteraceae bacterium]|nr:AAA family ATPase [Bryobacteraceae bacterium]
MKTDTTTVRGVVQAVFHAGATFSAGRLVADDGAPVRFAGKVFLREGEPVSLTGRWEDHPKYGRQFAVDALESPLHLDPAGLANYLAHHPDIKGIGPVKAGLIADTFGADFDRVIRADPRAVASAAKLTFEAVSNLRDIWIAASEFNAAMTYLASYGLTHLQVTTLVGKFGNGVVGLLQSDPYLLISEVPGFGFKRVDKIARRLGVPKELPARLRAGIHHIVQSALDDGDCWVEYEDLLDRANTLLVLDNLDSRERIERELEALISEKRLVCCPYERLVVADPVIHEMEEFLAGVFARASERNPHLTRGLPAASCFERLNEDQRQAVRNAFQFSISLMTGGAGSGKTFTVESLIRACEDLGISYALAAPTGKAAKRLEQSVKRPAQTVHRLLGFNGHTFAKGSDEKLDVDFLAIDELSMIDVPLVHQLFQAVDLSRTAVLLVGDHNQLPPVGPGNVLRDLIQSGAIPTTVLTKIIRQAGVLKENSTAILSGHVRPTCDEKAYGYRPWYVVNNFTDREHVRLFLEKLFHEVIAERLGFDLLQDVQVLTPTHKGPLGTVELNITLQRLLQKKLFGVDVAPVEPGRRPLIYPGDKVIQTSNDYDLGVMNGALGYVVENDPKQGLVVDFEGTLKTIPRGSAKEHNLQVAYANSIHRVQGSEFPCAIVIVHKSHSFMHHRNLLYTAVTRAQQSVILLGDRWGIEHCAGKEQVDQRNTFLSFFLNQCRRAE